MKTYQQRKESARSEAIEYQHATQDSNISWNEYIYITSYFYRLGKRYGLIKEFRENGII
jgi:hypothetical protein